MSNFKSIVVNGSCMVLGGIFGPIHFSAMMVARGTENAESFLVSKMLADVNRRDVILSRREVTDNVAKSIANAPRTVKRLFTKSKEIVLDSNNNIVPEQVIVK